MSQIFDRLDWQILINYDENPFQSFNNIAETLQVHHSTVSNRIKEMKNKQILRPNIDNYVDPVFKEDPSHLDFVHSSDTGVRTKTEVLGRHNPWKVGLQRIHLIFKRLQTTRDFKRLWKFLDEHPYTHYIARLFGFGLSVYAQFDIPPDTREIHLETFNKLKDEQIIQFDSIELFKDPTFFRYKPNYSEIQNQSSLQHLDILTRFRESVDFQDPVDFKQGVVSPDFDDIDARLIRELTINGKVKLKDISKYYATSLSTLSRRFNKIKEHYVPSGTLVFDANADKLLGFNNTQIVTGKFSSDAILNADRFFNFLNTDKLPFETFLTVQDEKFLIYTRGTVGMAGQLMEFLLEETDPYNLHQYQFYLNQSLTYPYYNGNYLKDEGYNTSISYIMDKPLNLISN